jgi:hypothetical protein
MLKVMKSAVNKKVDLELVGLNGNAYAMMGAFSHQARREKWTKEEIKAVIDDATSSDYNHLLCVLSDHCDPRGDESFWDGDSD